MTPRSATADNGSAVMRFASLLALSVALAVLAAGCGGGKSDEEKYADSVCSDIGTWKDQVNKSVNDVKTAVQSPGSGTLSTINSAVESAVNATNTLVSDLRSASPPDTDEGTKAKQDVQSLSSQAHSTVTNAKQTVNSLPKNASLSQIASTLTPLAGSLQSLSTKASSTIDSVKQAGSKMKDAVESSDACKKLS